MFGEAHPEAEAFDVLDPAPDEPDAGTVPVEDDLDVPGERPRDRLCR
jgi:hypothetical protein